MALTASRSDIDKLMAAVQLVIKYCERLKVVTPRTLIQTHLPIISGQLGSIIPKIKAVEHLPSKRLFTPSKRAEDVQAAIREGTYTKYYTSAPDIIQSVIHDLELIYADLEAIRLGI